MACNEPALREASSGRPAPRERESAYNSLCIDLKSFYASVECVERGLDPMTTDLVVADPERGGGTICLAVSASLKAKGVRNRCRVYEIPKGLAYIMAPPRMQLYIDYAAEIYGIYLKYLSKEDIHVYSVDEAFLNVAPYLQIYGMTAEEMAVMLMERVRRELGVRAAAGVGTNLYLAKVALDILAKHAENFIAVLDEKAYRSLLWDHRPLTDFWHVGSGTARRLARMGIFTMGQVAQADEEVLYHAFGIDAELLIDHAWGRESTTMQDIKTYRPKSTSLSAGQVLMRDYTFGEGRVILQEMTEQLCLDMLAREMATSSVTFSVGFTHALRRPSLHRTVDIPTATNASAIILPAVLGAYDSLYQSEDEKLLRGKRGDLRTAKSSTEGSSGMNSYSGSLRAAESRESGRGIHRPLQGQEEEQRFFEEDAVIRRFGISCNALVPEKREAQISLFLEADRKREKEKAMQETVLQIKNRFGKNALLRGADLTDAATAMERNRQIGGHKSGV